MFGRKRLQRENEALRKALAWYAAESHWQRRAVNPKGTPRQWVKSLAARDRGDRARQVLMFWGIGASPRPVTVPQPLGAGAIAFPAQASNCAATDTE